MVVNLNYDINKINSIIARMQQAANVQNPSQLAEFIGKSRSIYAGWKERNNVPNTVIELVALKTGYRKEWIKTGEGEKRSRVTPAYSGKVFETQAEYNGNLINLNKDEYTLVLMYRKLPQKNQNSLIKQVNYLVTAMDFDEWGNIKSEK